MSKFNPVTPPGSSRNYTPIFPEIAAEFGLTCAAVYGVVWRYAQMRDGTCHAAYETLAAEIGVNERTMRRKVEELQKAKLIHLHHRKNGGPYWISISADIQSDRTESPVANSEWTESPVASGQRVRTDQTESPIKIPTKKPLKRPTKASHSRKRTRRPKRAFWEEEVKALADHFAEVSGLRIPRLEGRAFAAVTKSWKLPLTDIRDLAGSVGDARKLISQTIREMRKDKLTISAPRSIWNNALSIHARGPTNGTPEPAGFAAIREVYGG
jgi:hypothetical protein